jgi:hypothetical protein
MSGADTVERLRQFLREVSPQARLLLIGELERCVLRGEEIAGADLVLQELRRVMREQRDGPPRIASAARLFFQALEPFLVDDRSDHTHPGRIARSSLDALWTWIRRDLLPVDAKILSDDVANALLANDEAKAKQITRRFQDRAVTAFDTYFDAAASDEMIHRRLLAQVGTPRADEDSTTLRCVLKGRDKLAEFAERLPLRIGNLANAQLDECQELIEAVEATDHELFLYALLMVRDRLAAPWQLVRLGTKAAGSDTAARVAETRYRVTVTIVLADLERMVRELSDELRSGRGIATSALLKTIHDSARGLRTELDLPIASTWGRALGGIRANIADLLRSEIESMPGRVRNLLRPRPSDEIRPYSVLDQDEVDETEALAEFVGACRQFATELAVSEMTQRAFSELRDYLEQDMQPLVDGARHAGPADRRFRQSQVDTAVRLCIKVFGKDYAVLMGRAAEVAGMERKAS